MEDSNAAAGTYILQRCIKDFRYSPLVQVENVDQETGEISIELHPDDNSDESKIIGNMYILLRYKLDSKGNIITDFQGNELIEPISIANSVILKRALSTTGNPNRVSGLATALVHYFQFLDDNQLHWHHMPRMKGRRPTYRFQRHLMDMANIKLLAGTKPNPDPYKSSTVKGMIREIVRFYRYLMDVYGFEFDYPPFVDEEVSISYGTDSASDMNGTKQTRVHSTDLRITSKSEAEKDRLIAMSEAEWALFDKQMRVKAFGVETNGIKRTVSTNNARQFQICRFAGLRADEAASLHSGNIHKPTDEQIEKNTYVDFKFGPEHGNRTKNGTTNRVCELPARLMDELFTYTRSKAYIKLTKEYRETADIRHEFTGKFLGDDKINTPLFLNKITKKPRKGKFKGKVIFFVDSVSSKTISNRFGEIARAIREEHDIPFPHTVHNLRSTYAVRRMEQIHEALINTGVDPARAWIKALNAIKGRLGHLSSRVTEKYLNQAQDRLSSFDMAEQVHDYAMQVLPSRFNK